MNIITEKMVVDYLATVGLTLEDMVIPNLCHINLFFAYQQKIDKKRLSAIKDLHVKRTEIFAKMQNSDDVTELRQLAEEVTQIDFSLQKEWGFSRDESYHMWWYRVPKCSCPKNDNEERRGFQNIYSSGCIIHGNKVVQESVIGETGNKANR